MSTIAQAVERVPVLTDHPLIIDRSGIPIVMPPVRPSRFLRQTREHPVRLGPGETLDGHWDCVGHGISVPRLGCSCFRGSHTQPSHQWGDGLVSHTCRTHSSRSQLRHQVRVSPITPRFHWQNALTCSATSHFPVWPFTDDKTSYRSYPGPSGTRCGITAAVDPDPITVKKWGAGELPRSAIPPSATR